MFEENESQWFKRNFKPILGADMKQGNSFTSDGNNSFFVVHIVLQEVSCPITGEFIGTHAQSFIFANS